MMLMMLSVMRALMDKDGSNKLDTAMSVMVEWCVLVTAVAEVIVVGNLVQKKYRASQCLNLMPAPGAKPDHPACGCSIADFGGPDSVTCMTTVNSCSLAIPSE